MLQYAHLNWLYLLLLVPLVVMLWWWAAWLKADKIQKLGVKSTVLRMMPRVSKTKSALQLILLSSSITCIVIALVNPMIGAKTEKVKRQGVDVIVALDVSNSMLAQDLQPNRLERSKQFITRLIEKLQNDRIGLVIFAGDAYLQLPLTTDYSAAKMFLQEITPGSVPVQGTSLANAITKSMASFVNEESNLSKTIVLLSDGENNEEEANGEAQKAADKKIIIHTVGVGTSEGAKIPMSGGGFKTDKDGQEVVTKMNPETLEEIATISGGNYFNFTGKTEEVNRMVNAIAKLDKKEYNEVQFTSYDSLYQWFLIFSLIALTIEVLIGNRAWRLNKTKLFAKNSI